MSNPLNHVLFPSGMDARNFSPSPPRCGVHGGRRQSGLPICEGIPILPRPSARRVVPVRPTSRPHATRPEAVEVRERRGHVMELRTIPTPAPETVAPWYRVWEAAYPC